MSRYVLIGPMGAGKSTVGGVLAARLGCPLTDTDAVIARRTGRTVQQIFADDGEPAFRAVERDVVAELLADPSVRVIALGGGAVMHPDTQVALAAAGVTTVFLDVPDSEVGRRVGSGAGRPLLDGDPQAVWRRLFADRRPTYERLATVVIGTGGRTPQQVADHIVAAGGS